MKVLFIGDLSKGSNAVSLARGLSAGVTDVLCVDSSGLNAGTVGSPQWVHFKRTGALRAKLLIHDDIDRAVRSFRPDVLFAFKTVNLDQERLLSTDVRLRIHYSPDDVSNTDNITADYLRCESQWDLIVTTKAHNVDELNVRAATNVLFVMSAYDPAWHFRGYMRGDGQRKLASFIGHYRPDRVGAVRTLARHFPNDIIVSGDRWHRHLFGTRHSLELHPAAMGVDLSRVAAEATAGLVFLNSANRDTHTCRTFEVPATGQLFIGQRTDEHRGLLDEETEALMFSDKAELIHHLHWVRQHPAAVATMAARAHGRVTSSQHTYADRARQILSAIS